MLCNVDAALACGTGSAAADLVDGSISAWCRDITHGAKPAHCNAPILLRQPQVSTIACMSHRIPELFTSHIRTSHITLRFGVCVLVFGLHCAMPATGVLLCILTGAVRQRKTSTTQSAGHQWIPPYLY